MNLRSGEWRKALSGKLQRWQVEGGELACEPKRSGEWRERTSW